MRVTDKSNEAFSRNALDSRLEALQFTLAPSAAQTREDEGLISAEIDR